MIDKDVDDPVNALKQIDLIGRSTKILRRMTPGMVMTVMNHEGEIEQSHPLDEVFMILVKCRLALLGKYGEMMWESADGPIDKSHRKDNVPSVSEEVLSEVHSEAGTNDDTEAVEDGVSVQRLSGTVGQDSSKGLLRRLLARVSRRKV